MGTTFLWAQAGATMVAMTSNYVLNNVLTYRDMRLRGWAFVRGWFSFVLACSVGALANVGIADYLFHKQGSFLGVVGDCRGAGRRGLELRRDRGLHLEEAEGGLSRRCERRLGSAAGPVWTTASPAACAARNRVLSGRRWTSRRPGFPCRRRLRQPHRSQVAEMDRPSADSSSVNSPWSTSPATSASCAPRRMVPRKLSGWSGLRPRFSVAGASIPSQRACQAPYRCSAVTSVAAGQAARLFWAILGYSGPSVKWP
jgi:hypothetical protein